MDAAFEARKRELLEECQVPAEVFEQVRPRLERFLEPYVRTFARREPCGHAATYVSGLLSDLESKNVESIADRFGQERRVRARNDQRQESPDDELLVVIRYRDRDARDVTKIDYYLSNASADTAPAEFARVAKAAHRTEECFEPGKSEAGLAGYEVRNWTGWQHHQTLSLIAAWFLVAETRRGKKRPPRSRCRKSARASPRSCTKPRSAVHPRASAANANNACHATNSPACTTGIDANNWRP